ncbi:MAG TPA: hypothetical protein VF796_17600 [Humisphaera sp.]
MYLVRGILVWIGVMAVETTLGIARTLWVAPRTGDLRARQLGIPVACAVTIAAARLTARWIAATSRRQHLAVGAAWAGLTVAFEVGLGLALGYGWGRITEDYDTARGGLMGLGVLVLLAAPLVAGGGRATRPAPRSSSGPA